MVLCESSKGYSLLEIDTESELREFCARNQAIILGELVENKMKYYIIELEYRNEIKRIGIINEGHGIKPSATVLLEMDLIIVASDEHICFVDLVSNEILHEIICDSLVYELYLSNLDTGDTVVVCELGVMRITVNGELIWKYDCEVIEDYKIKQDTIDLLINGKNIRISKNTGKEKI